MFENHEKVTTISSGNKSIFSTTFSVDGRLACGSADGSVFVHDVSTQQQTHKFDVHAMPTRSVAFSADGNILFSTSDDRQVQLYDVRNGQCIFGFSHKTPTFCVDASPDQRHFVVGCQDGSVSLWDLGCMSEIKKYDWRRDSVYINK
jgi:WD40 repeat protein